MRYIGPDVHKNNTTAAVISPGGKIVKVMDVRSNENGLRTIHEYMEGKEYCVMMESSTYSYKVYRFFESLGIESSVVHARSLKMITDTDKKTDKKDAGSIGRVLRLWKRKEIELSVSFIPTPEQMELKDVCRYREEISRMLGDEVRKIRSHMARNCLHLPAEYSNLSTMKAQRYLSDTYSGDTTLQRRSHRYLELLREKEDVSKDIESRLPNSSDVKLLGGIPGIGKQTAVQIMSMIVDIKRFDDPEKLCAYFGLVPKVMNSGGKVHHGRMTKAGDKMMREIMERVTLSHIQHCDSSITQYFHRKEKEMGTKKALITASRKMLAVIFAVLRDQRPFTA
ncbi:MAG: IS110 family transposase [Candidatus Methanoplasma sp.]|jgi:transposase|nr:IS110 family transposase [Candidatus Methanoplasma sp.]